MPIMSLLPRIARMLLFLHRRSLLAITSGQCTGVTGVAAAAVAVAAASSGGDGGDSGGGYHGNGSSATTTGVCRVIRINV
jgi:hypothetical protein